MATRTLRRTVATAALAGLATALAPMAVSLAAPAAFAASSITTDPKPDGSGVVAANRPVIKATFNATLASGSITLTAEGGDGTNLCPATSTSVSGSTVTCTPPNDLDKTKTFDAVGNGKNASGTSAHTSTLKFTVDYPILDGASSSPIPNGTLTNGGENITAAFDEAINPADSKNPSDSFKLFEVNADGSRGLQLPGTVTFNQQPVVGGSDGTITFNPGPTLANGHYEAVVFVIGTAPTSIGFADYSVFVNNTAPFNLSTPVPFYNGKPYANTSNNTAFPFSGNAAPGLSVTVSLTDTMDPNPLSNSYSGSTTVQPCASAPSCPWTVTIDISGFTSPQNNVAWSAQATDGNTATAKSNGPTFNVDYSAPATVTVNPAPVISPDSKSVSVNAQDTDTDVSQYYVTIADSDGNSFVKGFQAVNHNLPPTSIDVTTLDDGDLSITIQAVDTVGNVSAPGGSQPYHVMKTIGLLPNLGTSVLSSSGGDTTFQQAETQSVLAPTTVKLSFTQPIKESWTDNSNPLQPTTHHSSLCVASQNGNCVSSATPKVDSNDDHTLVIQLKNALSDGTYEIQALTYSKGACDDISPGGNPNNHTCEQFPTNGSPGVVKDPNTGQPFTFTVDSTKPTVTIDSYPHPVTGKNEKSAMFSGTVSKSAASVQLLIRSSGSTTTKLLFNATITPPTNASDPATWSYGPADLSPLPDGTLTIKATAKKGSGLAGTAIVHAQMKAHQAVLTEKASKGKVTFGHHVKVTGKLTDQAGAAISGENVTVKPKYQSGTGKAVRVITDSTGHYTAIITPKHNATLVASYAGSPQHDGVTVRTAKVGVRFAVKFTSPKSGASAASPVKVAGTVRPGHPGASVTFFRHTSSGNVVVGHAKLNKKSNFSTTLVLPPGTDKIFATVKATKGNLAGKSTLLTLHVS